MSDGLRKYDDDVSVAARPMRDEDSFAVPAAVKAAEAAVERLHHLSAKLVSQIGPVLGPDYPRPVDPSESRDGTGCGLADQIRNIVRDVEIACDRLGDALERCQL